MTLGTTLALLAVFAGGVAIALQAPINARLAAFTGDAVPAAAISFFVGFVVLAVVAVLRGTVPGLAQMSAAPWWAWAGGALGALYVWSAVWSVETLGVVTLVATLILGQLLTALALDAFGAFGVAAREITPARIASVALVAGGLVLSRL